MSSVDPQRRVVSGMRPTGRLHLGHYHGVLKNWVRLQHEYECFFFVADWHALTTGYGTVDHIEKATWDMVVDWLASGVNPGSTNLFIQSRVPEQAELYLLLSMITPQRWLERIPAYKDHQAELKEKNLATYGFLGYPLLQAADILAYRGGLVPVGADQVAHIEIARDVARRFNHLYGSETDFAANAEMAIRKLGKKVGRLYRELRQAYTSQGDANALLTAQALIKEQSNITLGDKERLLGYIVGMGKCILPEPQSLLSDAAQMPGIDGLKMSKSNDNTIPLRASADKIAKKIRNMPTDPARIRLSDSGDPTRCPVWQFHEVYSDEKIRVTVEKNCTNAAWGCLECKQLVIDAIITEQAPIRERGKYYEENTDLVHSIIAEGTERARDAARATLKEIRDAMGLAYR